MTGFIERDQWESFLNEFSRRNQLRPTRLEVIGEEVGDQEEEDFVPLVGVSIDSKVREDRIEILLGGQTAKDPRHVERIVEHVQHIVPILGTTSLEEGLALEDQEGTKTLLHFQSLPELSK